MNRNLNIIGIGFGLLLLIGAVLVGIYIHYFNHENKVLLHDIDLKHDRHLKIYAISDWETEPNICYSIHQGNNVLIPLTYLAISADIKLDFNIYFVEKDSLVAVHQINDPEWHEFLIIHDFKTGDNWPRLEDNEVSHDSVVISKWQKIWAKIKSHHPRLKVIPVFMIH